MSPSILLNPVHDFNFSQWCTHHDAINQLNALTILLTINEPCAIDGVRGRPIRANGTYCVRSSVLFANEFSVILYAWMSEKSGKDAWIDILEKIQNILQNIRFRS